MTDSIEVTFTGHEFCQWLVVNGKVTNETVAQAFLQTLVLAQRLICINQAHTDSTTSISSQWYAFAK